MFNERDPLTGLRPRRVYAVPRCLQRTVAPLLGCAVLICSGWVAAESKGQWHLLEEEDGVKVWGLEIPGQDMPGFRGQTVMAGSPDDILAVLENVEAHKDWMHRCVDSRTVRKIGPHHAVVYNRTSAPWPVWDRDVVVEADVTRSEDGKRVIQTFHNVETEAVEVPEHVVRMPRLTGQYEMVDVGGNRTRVDYRVEVDVGGSIPTWIAKRVARDMPYETLKQLEGRVLERLSR